MKLSMEQIEHEMKVISESGMEEILILTGESRAQSSVEYIGEACKLALILGGLYLIIRKIISWRIPVSFIGTVFVLTLIFGGVTSIRSSA